jgi:hypothetical protein
MLVIVITIVTHKFNKVFLEALKHFENSEMLDNTNVLNKYQKADVLVKLE